ncbi:Steroid 3-ketoacyl-CoA thiolase [Frankia canadensis]|uniref:Steroid 3-ketoacyl-CoA thiolase n=1 Tax=Frankia canadensis TaxID=1836972 RepID=A0A2I2KRV1_9ACTN|nr:acetyl-CoA C-acyltransferase [Frankia canadensis]SNQ48366.1 Steroid 3-ketoacyl-CoA thiolase [Frankia canadensis]SOU55656.1 Steroid 3-ketoacyl-CoA thiolase [Frankia canadensis]
MTGTEVVVVDACRSAIGKRKGSLKDVQSPDMLGDVLRGLFDRTSLDPALVGQVVAGCVSQVGQQAGNVVRNAWLAAGLPLEVGASTVHSQCGSSQQATTLAHGLVASGLVDIAVAAGVESMDQIPMGSSTDPKFGTGRNERYTEHYEVTTQFEGAERIAEAWGLSRLDLEEYAFLAQQRAARSIAEGRFQSQIVPINAPVTDDEGKVVGHKPYTTDEALRPTTLEGLAKLKTNLPDRPGGAKHTAGTSSQIADGASAVLLMTAAKAEQLGLTPRARLVRSVLVGSDPVKMLTGPIPATQKLLADTGLSIDDIDTFEVNEAFAAVVLAWQKELGADIEKVNVNGGAIPFGHPLGASGGILITRLVNELERSGGRYGLVTMCCGGGLGTGTIIERI